jgi:hypothetical protein
LVTEALRDQWFERYESQTRHPLGLLPVAAEHGYRLGYQAAMASRGETSAPSPPAGSLVEVVERAITENTFIARSDAPARAAIVAVAHFLEDYGWTGAAVRLEQEAGR